MKKSLLTIISFVFIALFTFTLIGCRNEVVTLDSLKNEYGVEVNGGGFEEGSTLISNEIETTSEKASTVLLAIANQNYKKDGKVLIFDVYVTKDGNKVQPNGKVKVSIPIQNIETSGYLLFHVKSDNSVENLPFTIEAGKISFETSSFSYFVIVEEPDQEHVHNYELIQGTAPTCTKEGSKEHYHCAECGKNFDMNYGEIEDLTIEKSDHKYTFVEEVEPTCKEEGTQKHYHCDVCGKNFDMNYGEIEDLTIEKSDHEYGDMYYANNPSFWDEGNIAYYHCEVCNKYFDEKYQEVESVVIPKLSTNLSICVNGEATPLNKVEELDSHIIWSLDSFDVTKGDVITICETNNSSITYKYFSEGNVDKEGIILTTAKDISVNVTATPNGIMLFIDGYKYEGIVIEINGEQYPMENVTYTDEINSYIYGYVYLEQGDEFVIIDNLNNIVYDHDDLDESYLWDTWDFHRGDDGEFVIDYAARYGIEFDYDGNKKIFINKVFEPVDGKNYEIVFEDESMDSVELYEVNIPLTDETSKELLWFITHEKIMNNEDIVSYINKHGLYIYTDTIYLESGVKFNLRNITKDYIITSDRLCEVYISSDNLTKDGDYVQILTSGYYMISYLPCFDGFMIEDSYVEEVADLLMYLDGEFIPLTINENNIAYYEGLVVDQNSNLSLVSGDYMKYYPIEIDSSVSSSIANVTESGGMFLVFFNKKGVFDISYNVETGILSIIDQSGDEPSDPIVDYMYFLSVVDSANGNKTLNFSRTPDENNEVVIKGAELFANCYIAVGGVALDGSDSSVTYGALSNTDSTLAESYGSIILVKKSGQFDVYFNIEIKSARLVLAEQAEPEECIFDEGVVTKEATHTEEGIRTYTCTVCGKTKEERIEKTPGHSFGDWLPDDTNSEKHYRECVCGDKEIGDCSFDEGVVTKEATHTEEGIRTYTCTVCGKTKEERIEKTPGHSFGDWLPDEVDSEKHYKACLCGEVETGDCIFEEHTDTETGLIVYSCSVCGREKIDNSGIIIVVYGGTATFEGKETVESRSNLYGEAANVYIAQANDVLNVLLTEQEGRTFKYWASATGIIIPDQEFSMLVLRSGYYYPVFEDTDLNSFSNRQKIYEGNCEEGTLYMSTNSKGEVKYELEFQRGGFHDFGETEYYNNQYHKQVCSVCNEVIYEKHEQVNSEIIKPAGHTEEGQVKYECYCGHEWLETIPVTEEHTVDYDDWHIVDESIDGKYGKYRVYCEYCDYFEEYWYLGDQDFIGFMDNKMINYQYTYGGKVCHDEYYYSYRNAEGQKVYIWAIQYENEYSSNADYNDTYIFMYIDDEDSTTLEPVYLSKSRGDRRAEYLWAIYGYAYDVNDWIEILDSPDYNIGCGSGMLLSNSMSARSSVFESYHNEWAETYNKLRIPTSKACDDLSGTSWEISFEGKAFQGGYYDENGEYVTTGGRDMISYVKDFGTSYTKYIHVDKATGITYGYEDYGTYYRTTFIMRKYKTIVSPEEFETLSEAEKSLVYSYEDIEKDVKSLCAERTAFNNFTLTIPETITAFRFLFSDPAGLVELSGDNVNVYYNTAYVYNSGSPITLTWVGEDGILFDRYEIWDFENQKWITLSESSTYVFNSSSDPRRTAAYVRVVCHEEDIPIEPEEMYRITVENGYFYLDGVEYTGTIEVPSGTYVNVYANHLDGKTFEYWEIGDGIEYYEDGFTITSNMIFTPVYTDASYNIYVSGWEYESYVSINGGEYHYTGDFVGKIGDTFELSTILIPDGKCNVFIGWFIETNISGSWEYILLSESETYTYEITGNESGSIYAVWTTGDNPFVKKYVDIRVVNGFATFGGGEVDMGGLLDNAFSAMSVSRTGRAKLYDDPTDETLCTFWDVTYRYELDGELIHEAYESFEDEYGYYTAAFWIDDPNYSYPDGEINVTGTDDPSSISGGSGEVIMPDSGVE